MEGNTSLSQANACGDIRSDWQPHFDNGIIEISAPSGGELYDRSASDDEAFVVTADAQHSNPAFLKNSHDVLLS